MGGRAAEASRYICATRNRSRVAANGRPLARSRLSRYIAFGGEHQWAVRGQDPLWLRETQDHKDARLKPRATRTLG
jgi:hypothetical protein